MNFVFTCLYDALGCDYQCTLRYSRDSTIKRYCMTMLILRFTFLFANFLPPKPGFAYAAFAGTCQRNNKPSSITTKIGQILKRRSEREPKYWQEVHKENNWKLFWMHIPCKILIRQIRVLEAKSLRGHFWWITQ